MCDFVESLNKACSQRVPALKNANVDNLDALWTEVIKPQLPPEDMARKWHKNLVEYVKRDDAYFVLRAAYANERRGFLTRTNKFSFFYSDDDHAYYYAKMAKTGMVVSPNTLWEAYHNAQFPVKFGRWDEREKSHSFLPKGMDPRYKEGGYRLAYVYPVTSTYDGPYTNRQQILDAFFPLGSTEDWQQGANQRWMRNLDDRDMDLSLAKKYAVAMFLRLVHPFNQFMLPANREWLPGANVVYNEDGVGRCPLIDYVGKKFRERYGEDYDEFLGLIIPLNAANGAHSANNVAQHPANAVVHAAALLPQWSDWSDWSEKFRTFLEQAGFAENTITNYVNFVRRAFDDQTHGVPPKAAWEVRNIVNRFANSLYEERDPGLPYGAAGHDTGINSLKQYRQYRTVESYRQFLWKKHAELGEEVIEEQVDILMGFCGPHRPLFYEAIDHLGDIAPRYFADFQNECYIWFV